MKSAVTISLVPEAKGGPFVFWDGLDAGMKAAAELGFDAVEIFPPAPDAVAESTVRPLLDKYKLKLAAVGTGAGWVKHKLRLTDPDPAERVKAIDFVRSIIDAAGKLGASTIIGSMQGKFGPGPGGSDLSKEATLDLLADALRTLGQYASQYNVPLIYEPLNRYETNLVNDIAGGVKLIQQESLTNVVLLADLFHMNIEEADIARAIRAGGHHIGHVHLADSNRRPAGLGHTNFAPIAEALRQIGYKGYVSAEAFAYPDSAGAARHTIEVFKNHFS